MSRLLLKDKAYAELKRRITEGHLAPGRFLAERGLAEELGMSKTPVRAAVGRLEMEGFLAVSPQQGIVVREPSFREITDHFDVRIALEAFVAQQLAGRLPEGLQASLRHILAEQRRHADAAGAEPYAAADAAFHRLLGEALGNGEMARLLGRQLDKLRRTIVQVLREDPARMRASTDEHARILDALAAGDGAGAAELMREHLNYAKSYLI